MGSTLGCPRHRRSGRVPIVNLNLSHVCISYDAGSQLDHANYRTRSRPVRHQFVARTRWRSEDCVKTRHLSQTRSKSARRIYFLRSSKRPRPNSNGDGLEGRAFTGRKPRRARTGNRLISLAQKSFDEKMFGLYYEYSSNSLLDRTLNCYARSSDQL